jgi:hypothetical protein
MNRFFHPQLWRRHHRRIRVILRVGEFSVELPAKEWIHMAITMNAGQSSNLSIAFLDQNGQPMATPPTPDAPPGWANTAPASVDTLLAAPGGMTSILTGVGAGTDTVRVSLAVGGVQFAATLDVTIDAAVSQQTLTSIGIVASTPA